MHGLSYPVDVSGVSLMGARLVNIEREEAMAAEARELLQNGVLFSKAYFQTEKNAGALTGVQGMLINNPVFFRDESGEIGFMVKVTSFGTGEINNEGNIRVERISQNLWKAENFAYFIRRGYSSWKYGGWVF